MSGRKRSDSFLARLAQRRGSSGGLRGSKGKVNITGNTEEFDLLKDEEALDRPGGVPEKLRCLMLSLSRASGVVVGCCGFVLFSRCPSDD